MSSTDSDGDDDQRHCGAFDGEAPDDGSLATEGGDRTHELTDEEILAQLAQQEEPRDGLFDPQDGVPKAKQGPANNVAKAAGPARRVFDLRGGTSLPPELAIVGGGRFVTSPDGASYVSLDPMSFLRVSLPFTGEDVERTGGGGAARPKAAVQHESKFNYYTITFDMRVPFLPDGGLSLVQTSFPDPHETDEAWLTPALNIGVFSEVDGEPLFRVGKWNRIVITVGGPFSQAVHDRRKLTAYINGRKCSETIIKYGPDTRFGLRKSGFLLFASSNFARMQCPVDVKYLKVTTSCDTAETVLQQNRTDSIFSQFANAAAATGTVAAASLTLGQFLSHPHPIWMDATFLAMFGDPYVCGTGLGQNESYLLTAQVLAMTVTRMLAEQQAWLQEVSDADACTVRQSVAVLEASLPIFRRFQLAAKGPAQLIAFLKFKDRVLATVAVGQSALMPCGWRNSQTGQGSTMLLELHRVASDAWDVTVVNLGGGLTEYHPCDVFSPKIKYKTCVAMKCVPSAKILDDAWWSFVFSHQLSGGPRTTAASLYSHLFPFLTDGTFESCAADACDDPNIPYRTLPRSGLTMHRNFVDWMNVFWRRNGVSDRICKMLLFNLRRQYVRLAVNDLSIVGSVTDSDKHVMTLALQQTARRAIRLHEMFGLDSEFLAETMSDAKILQMLEAKNVGHSENVVPPQPLRLTNDALAVDTATQHFAMPCMERLLRKEDTDGLVGKRIPALGFVPIDFLQIPQMCATFEDALTAVRYLDKCCTMASVQASSIKNADLLKVSTIQLVFTQVVPTPLGPHADRPCIWQDTPMRYGVQLDVLILLARIMEHFASSCLSLNTNRSFDAVRIVISGVIVAIADCVMRKRSTDHPSEVFETLREKSYGVSIGMFAPQSETIEVTAPEIHVARTSVMDYFARVDVKRPMFMFEKSLSPDDGLVCFLEDAGAKMAFPTNPVQYTVDSHHYIIKNFPEFQCYRDLCFYWKFFMNTEDFPDVMPYTQRHAELQWSFNPMSNEFVVKAFGRPLACRAAGHRWASGAIAGRYTAPVPVFTEDDILHIHSFTCFEKTLTQKDVELLLSFLIVPYLRIPLTLNFFATADRIHTLRDKKLRHLLDSVLFEPSRYLELGANYAPSLVPSEEPKLIASPYGLLFNELHYSPDGLIRTLVSLIQQARKLDVGTVYSSTVGVILYVVRLLVRVESAIVTLLRIDQGTHPSIKSTLRDVKLSPSSVAALTEGLATLHDTLRSSENCVQNMLEAWLLECHERMKQAIENPDDSDSDIDKVSNASSGDDTDTESDADTPEESLLTKTAAKTASSQQAKRQSEKEAVHRKATGQGGNTAVDRNVRIACRLHAHLILMYRNTAAEDHTLHSVTTLLSSHQYLQTRHTWNHLLLEIPETEIFEAMAIQRRGLVHWFTKMASPSMVNHALEAIVRVTAGTGMRHAATTDSIRCWDFITGPRSVGRYTIASGTRSVVPIASVAEFDSLLSSGAKICVDFFASWCPPCRSIAPIVKLLAQQIQGVQFRSVDVDALPTLAARFASRAVPTFVTFHRGVEFARLEGADPNRLREMADRLNRVLTPVEDESDGGPPRGVAPEDVKYEEVNLQTFTLLLKAGHLRALDDHVQADYDVQTVFRTKISMQCAVVEQAEHRHWFRLIGRFHDIQYWTTPDPSPALQVNDREYDPGCLGRHEQWILPLFEPVRLAFFNDPMSPVEFVLPEEELSASSTVAYIVALHPKRGGTWKEVFVFRDFRTVHVYDVVSYGRRNYRTLVYATDSRFCMRELQPEFSDRRSWWPSWCRYGAGVPNDDPPPGSGAVILRDMRACGNMSGSEEMFVPQRFLFGLIPQVLVDDHLFWQDSQDNITGYPLDPKATHLLKITFSERRKFGLLAAMPSDCLAQVRWVPQLAGEAFLSAPAGRDAAAVKESAASLLDPELQLVNLMYAPAGSALHSLACTLSRLDNLGHILVWAKTLTPADAMPSAASSLLDIYQVRLPRLKLTFTPRRNLITGELQLFSVDHVDLFISNDRPSLVMRHMRGVPQSLLLSTINREYHVLVPSIRPVRPFISSSPFSTELVLDRSSSQGALWRSCTATPYYIYPVHVSMSFLQSTTLAAALYLLLLRFSFRDYEEVARLVDTVATDTDFSNLKEELQAFKMLGSLTRDQNPNAHASRLKISVVMADSPVPTPWLLDLEMAELINKTGHLRSACQLSLNERLQLLEECLAIEKMLDIATEAIKEVGPENIKKILQATLNPESALELTFQEKKQHDALFSSIQDRIFASVRRRASRADVIEMMVRVFKGQRLSEYHQCLWKNNKTFLESFVNSDAHHTAGTKTAVCVVPRRSTESKWRTAPLPFVFSADPNSWCMILLNDASPRAVSDGIVLDVINALLSGQTDVYGGRTGFSFLFFYQLFQRVIKFRLGNCSDGFHFASLALPLLVDYGNSLLVSILHVVSHNPHIVQPAAPSTLVQAVTSAVATAVGGSTKFLPRFNDTRRDKSAPLSTNPEEGQDRSPLRDLFSEIVAFMKKHQSSLRIPIGDGLLPKLRPARQVVDVPLTAAYRLAAPTNTPFGDLRVPSERCGYNPVPFNTLRDRLYLPQDPPATSKNEDRMHFFIGEPLGPVGLAEFVQRTQLAVPIAETLPFDVSKHPSASSHVAKKMLERFRDEKKRYAEQTNSGATWKIIGLEDDSAVAAAISSPGAVIASLEELCRRLRCLREHDAAQTAALIEEIVLLANSVDHDPSDSEQTVAGEGASVKTLTVRQAKLHFELRRFCCMESSAWTEYLVSALISDVGLLEWTKLNPFVTESAFQTGQSKLVRMLLHANRVGHANRALQESIDLIRLLSKAKGLPNASPESIEPLRAGIVQKCDSLGSLLGTRRHYIEAETIGGITRHFVDPRFLLFEFTWNLVLRESQIIMVRSFMNELNAGRSSVWQMIMGAGKTTVVGPLLALLLATGKQLVVQIVPPALLEFSRSVMRSTFSSVIKKRIYTFSYDRSTECDPTTYRKLLNAQSTAGVVISTPTSVKSLMLKFIENLDWISDTTRPRPPSLPDSIQEIYKIVALFRQSVLMLDEVDLILHPLKSELNFPIGAKEPLDFSPLRWQLPVHILDAIFYAERGTISVDFRTSSLAQSILHKIKKVIQDGYAMKALQANPHAVLLDQNYYHSAMRPLFAQWSLLWIEAQNFSGISRDDVLYYISDPRADHDEDLKAKVTANVPHRCVQMLNLAQDWLRSFLPHILAKIDRVSFGIMTKADKTRALHNTPNMPRSRLMLAIPFVGKDVPSDASEFAHPDIIIGLTILAYRYEGLRFSDFKEILSALREVVLKEHGPWRQRKTNQRYEQWVREAGGRIRGAVDYRSLSHVVGSQEFSDDYEDDDDGLKRAEPQTKKLKTMGKRSSRASKEVVSLRLLKQSSKEQILELYFLLRKLPDLIHWYLNEFIFPTHMRFQHTKISASGQDIGGNMLFPRRVGFSGTPSDLLPIELGRCQYEAGSDGLVIHTLTSQKIVSFELVEDGWSPANLLTKIAVDSARCGWYALIDTGALITGMSNLQVAQFLLDAGLEGKEGVVFLDELDRKMILVRATGRVLKLDECGIPLDQRFAFYDQIHTTGMDIRHTSNATAVLTLGKDMTFRDYAQGAFRMRGINKGQKIHLFITPEVRQLMVRELSAAAVPCVTTAPGTRGGDENVLREVCGWLVINSMLSERLQFNQLCLQNVTNVYRKNGFANLLRGHARFRFTPGNEIADDHCLGPSLEMFREPVEFKLEASVPQPRLFSEIIAELVANKKDMFITTESETAIIASLIQTVQGVVENGQERAFNQDMVREQEEEKEKMKEIVEEKELEITQFKDQQYMRDMEEPSPWLFCGLSDFEMMTNGEPAPFYAASEFKLFARQPLRFPHNMLVSNNFFDKRWSGQRRVKNVVIAMEWVVDRDPSSLFRTTRQEDLAAGPPMGHDLHRTVEFMKSTAAGGTATVDLPEAAQLCATAFELPTEEAAAILLPAGGPWQPQAVEQIVSSPLFRQEDTGRRSVCLSLVEAETIRRILHVKSQEGGELIEQSRTDVALRCVCCENYLLDKSAEFTPAPQYQTTVTYECFRFLDCETHFRNAQINHLLKGVQQSLCFERRLFFEQIIGCKRRNQKNWDRTPVSRVFSIEHEYTLLHLRTLALRMRTLLRKKGMMTYDAFTMFDFANVGSLSCANLLAGMQWLGLQPTHEDVLNFVSMASAKRDTRINYPEWVDMMCTSKARGTSDTQGRDGMSRSFSFDDEGSLESELPRTMSAMDEDSSTAAAAASDSLPFGDRIKPIDEEVFDLLHARREANQNEQKRQQEEAMKAEEKRIRKAVRQHKRDQQQARGADDNPSARNDCLWFDFGTGHLPDDVTTVGYTYFEPTKAAPTRQQLRADPASMVVLPVGNYGMPWDDVLQTYTLSMYVTVPRRTSEEEAEQRRLQKLSAATGVPRAKKDDEDNDDEDDADDNREKLMRLQDPDRIREVMTRSLSDENHCFPVAGSPLLQLNRHIPGGPVICVTADGRVGLSDEDREDRIVTGTKVLWQWQSDSGWVDFDHEHIRKIEREYQRDPKSSATFRVFGIGEFVVNFRSMSQRNQQNNATRPVRRHQRLDGNRVEPDKPTLVTVVAILSHSKITTFVNGIVSAEYTLRDPTRLAIDTSHQIFLFGHGDTSRTAGGSVEWVSLTNSAFSAAEVAAMYQEVRARTDWECSYCTIRNDDSQQQCHCCEMPRAAKQGASSANDQVWICPCSTANSAADGRCGFCQLPRGAKLS
jgi:thiol-disulfide isomerase/thioredoxin